MTRPRTRAKSGARPSRGALLLGWLLLILAAISGLPLLVLGLFTELQTKGQLLIALATFIPFGWLPCLLGGAGLVVLARRAWKVAGIVVLLVAALVWGWPNVPYFRGQITPVPAELGIELISANVQYGRADLDQLLERIGPQTDLLIFQEYTSGFDAKLREAGLAERFPYRVGTIRRDAGGTMILSTAPLTEVARTTDAAFDNILVEVRLRDADWLIAAVHTAPPQLGADRWASDGAEVLAMLTPHLDERLVVVGDFNAIDEHHTMRQFAAAGFRNAMAQPGLDRRSNSWEPTWPINHTLPPFARIDHALTSPAANIWRPDFFEVAGTDHKAMVVRGPK